MRAFTGLVDPLQFTISNSPDYVFLCGGPLENLDHSLRAHFYGSKVKSNSALLSRTLLAEDADKWYRSQREFRDLLELEEHIAGLSACILLFVESPGAIAEFGAFSQMKLIQEKLLVVVEESYYAQQSFIRNGLIERTQFERPDNLLSYFWLKPPGTDCSRKIDSAFVGDALNEIEVSITRFLAARPKTSRFAPEDHGHRMLLISDLIKVSRILLQGDIQELLERVKVEIKPQDLKRYLYLLEQLGLISKRRYGNNDFFVATGRSRDFVHYAPRAPTDRARLRALLWDEFPLIGDKKKALDSFERRSPGVMP